jgi:WD40 repeat protein
MRQVLGGIVMTSMLIYGVLKIEREGLSSLLSNSGAPGKTAALTISDVEWSADGQTLSVQSRGGFGLMRSLSFHRLIDGKREIPQWAELLRGDVYDASMSADGTSVVLTTSTGKMVWIDIETSAVTVLDRPDCCFARTAISRDGQITAGARSEPNKNEDEVYLWYPARGEVRHLSIPPLHTVTELRFSAEGSRVLCVLMDGSTRVWETAGGSLVEEISGQQHFVIAAAFLENEDRIISLSADNVLQISDVLGGAVHWHGLPRVFTPGGVAVFDVNSSGTIAAWGEKLSSRVIVWDIEQQRVKFAIENPSAVMNLKFSPDGTSLAVGGTESIVRIYDSKSGEQTQALDICEV